MTSYLKQYPPAFQLVVFFGISLGCFVIYNFFFMGWAMPRLTGVTAYDLQNGDLSNAYLLEVMKWMQLLYSVFCFLVPALVFFYLSHPEPMRYAGMRERFRLDAVVISIVILLLSLPAVGMLGDWNQHIHFGSLDQSLRAWNQKLQDMTVAMLKMPNWRTLVYNLVLIAVIPAIAEEMFFRGVLQRLFVRMSHRAWVGILIASVVFSLVHVEMLGFFPRAALGIILGLIYYFSGNLWYSILAHFVNNGAQVLLLFLFQRHYIHFDISKNTPTPVAAGVISVVVVIGLFVVFWKFIPRKSATGIFERETETIDPPVI
jgi:membrane protease YdiL (CAAX protease family)